MANATFGVNILPKDNTVSLGNSTSKWNIESPNLTGTPTAPTASAATNNTQVATTAFVQAALSGAKELNDKLSAGMTYVVNGNKSIETSAIPVGSYVRLVNSTISGRSDGIYTVATAIPVDTAIDGTYFNESAPIPGGVANALNSKTNYSATEQEVGKWIDGKTIYRMIYADNVPSSRTSSIDVSSLNIDTMINMYGMAYHTQYGNNWNIPHHNGEAGYDTDVNYQHSTNKLWVSVGSYFSTSSSKYYIAIEYTKV